MLRSVPHPIQWTADPRRRFLHHVGINHRRPYVVVSQQLLHGANVLPHFQQVSGERVTERVTGGSLGPFELPNRRGQRPRQSCFVNMVAADAASAWATRQSTGCEQELPAQFVVGIGKLPIQRISISTRP